MLLQIVMETPKLPDSKVTEIEKNFGKSLEDYFFRHLKPKGVSQKQFARQIGLKQPTLNAIFAGRRGSTERWRRDVAKYIGLKYESMIGIDDEGCLCEKIIPLNHQSHFDIIRRFRDTPRAERINEMMVEIEGVDPDQLDNIEAIIKAVRDRISTAKKIAQKNDK